MTVDDVRDLWEVFHPADDADEDIEDEFTQDEDVVPPAEIPTLDKLPDVVDYSTRGPNDFVVSGPMGVGRGAGRRFESEARAYLWALGKYGKNRVVRIPQESEFRWALLIKAA